MQPDETTPENESAPPEAKAPSPLRSAGALHKTPWPHAPLHQLSQNGTCFVTAGTYLKQHHFRGRERLRVLHRGLLTVAGDFGWQLEAWAVFSNHYHFVAHSPPEGAGNLSRMLGKLHEKLAKWVNKLDTTAGRKVWFNFRETRLTYEKSYLARLNYTHRNAVKHKLVLDREACCLYKEALDKHLPPEYSQVVISQAGKKDAERLKRHYLSGDAEQAVRKAFRKPDEQPKILIVTEKLLTGREGKKVVRDYPAFMLLPKR